MATYVATNTTYPTIGEVIRYLAVTSGLVVTDSTDRFYEDLKPFVREQKGKDFGQLDKILDELERRLETVIAPPGLGKICFDVFRRVLDKYKTLILLSRTNSWSREQFVEEKLVPGFIVPYAAWLLKNCVFRTNVTAHFGIVTGDSGDRDRRLISGHRDRPFRDRDRPFRPS